MELHPFLETDTCPNSGLWYVLSCIGESPSMRVGHTCTFIKPTDRSSSKGKVYVIGGANPSGSFGDVYVLDLDTLQWDTADAPGFKPRYEHVAFSPAISPEKIYVFGGADQSGNLNDIQVLDTEANSWSTLTVQGNPPTPRTHHTTAVVGNKLVVYSGGHSGPDPVGDRKIHIFDAATSTWTQPSVKGDPPKPRHGHVMLALGNKVYVHGGMAGTTFYDDLHVLDLEKEAWSSVKKKKGSPTARAAHGGCVHGTDLYIFGGMNRDGALDDMLKLDTGSMTWSSVKLEGPPPASRLDFGMCVIELAREVAACQDTAATIQKIAADATNLLDKEIEANNPNISTTSQTTDEPTSTDPSQIADTLQLCDLSATTEEGTKTPEDNENISTNRCNEADRQSPAEVKLYKLCLINGGMDTQGEIFDDTLVISIA